MSNKKNTGLLSNDDLKGGPEKVTWQIMVTIVMSLYFFIKITWRGIRAVRITPQETIFAIFFIAAMALYFSVLGHHLRFLYWLNPHIFKAEILNHWHNGYTLTQRLIFHANAVMITMLFINGIVASFKFRKHQRALNYLGLKGPGEKDPKVVNVYSQSELLEVVQINAFGIGVDQFRSQKHKIAACFEKAVHEISAGRNPSNIKITFRKSELQNRYDYPTVANNLKNESFIIGKSYHGTLTQKLSELPHMLIAGATGRGKSAAFKQIILGLLKSTKHLQVYLIDLKMGLEFTKFSKLPNVELAESTTDALLMLQRIKSEMHKRFKYLRKHGKQKLSESDPFDLVVVGIDEASVLYMPPSKSDPNYDTIIKARQITDEIAKLSRAARISLIFSTQKVSKDTIDTKIQENISGKLCFKQNTLEGSVRVLGDNSATKLPMTQGRAIWQLGGESKTVQVPYASNADIDSCVSEVTADFSEEKKSLKNPMLSESKKRPKKAWRNSLKSSLHSEADV